MTAHISGFNVQTAGTLLVVVVVVGIVGLLLALVYTFVWADRTRRSQVVDHEDRRDIDPRY